MCATVDACPLFSFSLSLIASLSCFLHRKAKENREVVGDHQCGRDQSGAPIARRADRQADRECMPVHRFKVVAPFYVMPMTVCSEHSNS